MATQVRDTTVATQTVAGRKVRRAVIDDAPVPLRELGLKYVPAILVDVGGMADTVSKLVQVSYRPLHAYYFENASGEGRWARYHSVPEAGVAAQPPRSWRSSRDYLYEELEGRLRAGPVAVKDRVNAIALAQVEDFRRVPISSARPRKGPKRKAGSKLRSSAVSRPARRNGSGGLIWPIKRQLTMGGGTLRSRARDKS